MYTRSYELRKETKCIPYQYLGERCPVFRTFMSEGTSNLAKDVFLFYDIIVIRSTFTVDVDKYTCQFSCYPVV